MFIAGESKIAKRKKLTPKEKKALIEEAGNKCANPGCPAYLTEGHHIKEWAVYQTNDLKHMIAICGECHDQVHRGVLSIDDETLYLWKKIPRTPYKGGHIYVEPGPSSKLSLGGLFVTCDTNVIIFELSSKNRLSFRVLDGDIFIVNLTICTIDGQEVIRVIDNHIKREVNPPLLYDARPGRVRITAPVSSDFLPAWALMSILVQEPDYATNGQLILLDMEVLEPGLVKVQGIWAEKWRAIVITKNRLAFLTPGRREPLSLCSDGAVLHWSGPINTAMFGFG